MSRLQWDNQAEIVLTGSEFEAVSNLLTVLTSDDASDYTKSVMIYETSKLFPPIFKRLMDNGVVTEVSEDENK